ncbi:MAG: hypothetical protein KGI84_07955 [Elusimicrobia bacterium]|nr:hypothetical protein [Elusimicrobiota bacterium]
MKDKLALGVLLLPLLLSGCWFGAEGPKGPAPSWASAPSGVVSLDGKELFRGVGHFVAPAKARILRQGADDQAQAAIARAMSGYLDALAVGLDVSFSSASSTPPLSVDSGVSLRRAAMDVLKTKSVIGARWVAPGQAWSLCTLDFGEFKKDLARSPGLPAGTTSYLAANEDKAFARVLVDGNVSPEPSVEASTASAAAVSISTSPAGALAPVPAKKP